MSAHVPGPWPALPYTAWKDTLATLHMEMQILGKVRVAFSEPELEFAHVALYITRAASPPARCRRPRDLRSRSRLLRPPRVRPYLVGRGAQRGVRRTPDRCVLGRLHRRAFGRRHRRRPADHAAGSTRPHRVPRRHRARRVRPRPARRFWEILTLVQPVFAEYRAAYRGRTTPVHFFWGSMDLAVTRFSGRPCDPPEHAGFLDRGTYDAEQISIGWWPGSENFPEPAFYAYSYPKGEGIEGRARALHRVLERRAGRAPAALRRRPHRRRSGRSRPRVLRQLLHRGVDAVRMGPFAQLRRAS